MKAYDTNLAEQVIAMDISAKMKSSRLLSESKVVIATKRRVPASHDRYG